MFRLRIESKKWLITIAALTIVAIVIAYRYVDPIYYPKCLFKLITGWDCPGCGMQRALHELLQGHFCQAWHYNQLFVVAVPYAFLCVATKWNRGKHWADAIRNRWCGSTAGRVVMGIILVYVVLRNIV